jgi:hypothetical protein
MLQLTIAWIAGLPPWPQDFHAGESLCVDLKNSKKNDRSILL